VAFALIAAVLTSCTGGGSNKPTRFLVEFTKGVPQLSLLGLGPGATGGDPNDPIQRGTNIVAFDLSEGTTGQLMEGGSPEVYLTREGDVVPLGPYHATWSPFTGYAQTVDHSPKSAIPGVYFVQLDFPRVGVENVLATSPLGRSHGVGRAIVYVGEPKVALVGSKATSVKTPVATTEKGLREVCTRQPPDPMHYISLDHALKNGKPTVAVFSTPLFCESQLCGPVTDEVLLLYQKYGKTKANFVHIEEFLPGPDLKPDASKLSPGFVAWKFTTEPWVIVIDGKGIIRARFIGPATAPMIDEALTPLLKGK
jgi:hypothetical protein